MAVFLAEHRGFCFGVKRALKMALECCGSMPAHTLGQLIHNPQVVTDLKSKGIQVADSLDEISESIVIIRSHGIGPEKYAEAAAKKLKLIDATCPFVKNAQLAARKFWEEGYQTIIVGEKDHPEVQGIYEWTNKQAIIVSNIAEAKKLSGLSRCGIVAQTTFSQELFADIVQVLKQKAVQAEVKCTICSATVKRQEAAVKLTAEVDLMLVIGGRSSANTARLAQVCKSKNSRVVQIETAEEVDAELLAKAAKIGITAGASTPDYLIEEIEIKCRSLKNYMKVQ